jgi:hypothetical protein
MKLDKTQSPAPMYVRFARLMLLGLILSAVTVGGHRTLAQIPPNFGPNVYIIDPSMSSTTILNTLTSLSNEAQFSTNRYAVLFLPGTYSVQAPVGYYESIAGLGQTPGAVTINGFLTPNFGSTSPSANVTTTFWRSMENMTINAATDTAQSGGANTLQWGVSQGAPLRRMLINGSLELTDSYCGEASGGFISDTVVTGNVNSCSQQQWYTRNSTLGSWSGSLWNMVFSGVQGAPTPNYPANAYTVLPTTPVNREKPYLYVDSSGDYNVFVPTVETNSTGATWLNGSTPGYSIPIGQFFIAQPTTSLADINTALAYGQNLILTPGIYQYNGSINITNPNTIVLGLGYATIVPQNGTSAITVADVDGVQIAGLIIDAGPISSPVLLQVGVPGGSGVSHQSNPTSINDVFIRIGGATAGTAVTSMEIDSNNVILDDIWAWRADHGAGSSPIWTGNAAQYGVVVNGNNVTALGLAVEHYEQNQVIWNGNGGETIFYQSELPYDVPGQSAWMNGGVDGYSSYAVSNSVTTHAAYGLGVYSYFDQGLPIVENSAITVPNAVGVTVTDAVSVFLAGNGQITYTVNNAGTVAEKGSITSFLPFYQGAACSTTCPEAPGNLEATTISPTQINLTWTASPTPGVVYSIFRSVTAGFVPSAANQIVSGVSGSSYADTTVSPASTYYYVLEASSVAGASAGSNQASATTTANKGGAITTDVIKIDSGLASGTLPTGWVYDTDVTGTYSRSSITHAITIPSGTVNPAPAAVYQTYTHGSSFTYAIPGLMPGNSYIVDLHFTEDYSGATSTYRKFNVAINGTQVLTNFNIYATAGGLYTANVQSFYAVADATGTISIAFTTGAANSPTVNGIEIGQSNLPVPSAPTGPVASTVSDSQINLSWSASSTSGVAYEVFRSTTSGFTPSPSNLITTTPNIFYSDTALTPSTTYYYVVEANDGFFTSLPSTQTSATSESVPVPPLTVPAAPTALIASSASSSQINLLWTGSSTHSVQYEVFRSTTPGFAPASNNLVTTTWQTGFSDTGLLGSTPYYYLVEAVNGNGASLPSNQASATTAPDIPASVAVVSGSGQTAPAGTSFTNPLVVIVEDAGGIPVPEATVTFAGAGVAFPSGATAVTNESGQAQVTAQASISGPLTITASVAGVTTPASFSETGTAIAQSINLTAPLSPVSYGAGPISLVASSTSGLAVTFSVTGPAMLNGSVLTITGAGQVNVTASQAGNSVYAAATTVSYAIVVNPVPLVVTANNASMTVGAAIPGFTASYSGFVNGDTAAVLSGAPALSTSATASSPVGTYPITAALGTLTSANYTFTFFNGTLSVVAAPAVSVTTNSLVTGSNSAGYTLSISIKNTGTGTVNNVVLSSAKLGATSGTPLPQTWGTLAAGATATFTVAFPGSVGLDGKGVAESYSGTFSGGSFSTSLRSITLP